MRRCAHCGRSLDGGRRQARYCSGACRAAASRARRRTAFGGETAQNGSQRVAGGDGAGWARLDSDPLGLNHDDLIDSGRGSTGTALRLLAAIDQRNEP
jgi:hypothetical protein